MEETIRGWKKQVSCFFVFHLHALEISVFVKVIGNVYKLSQTDQAKLNEYKDKKEYDLEKKSTKD